MKFPTKSFQIFMIVMDWRKQKSETVLPTFFGPTFFVLLPLHAFCLTLLFFLFPFLNFLSFFLCFFPFLFLFDLFLFLLLPLLLFLPLLLVDCWTSALLVSLDDETFPETSDTLAGDETDEIARINREMRNNLITLILKLNCFQITIKIFKCSCIWQ